MKSRCFECKDKSKKNNLETRKQIFEGRYLRFWVNSLVQCFSTFFDSRHPSFLIEQFGVTHSYNLLLNRRQIHKLGATLKFFTAPKGSVAPWLRTTALVSLSLYEYCGVNRVETSISLCSSAKVFNLRYVYGMRLDWVTRVFVH